MLRSMLSACAEANKPKIQSRYTKGATIQGIRIDRTVPVDLTPKKTKTLRRVLIPLCRRRRRVDASPEVFGTFPFPVLHHTHEELKVPNGWGYSMISREKFALAAGG